MKKSDEIDRIKCGVEYPLRIFLTTTFVICQVTRNEAPQVRRVTTTQLKLGGSTISQLTPAVFVLPTACWRARVTSARGAVVYTQTSLSSRCQVTLGQLLREEASYPVLIVDLWKYYRERGQTHLSV